MAEPPTPVEGREPDVHDSCTIDYWRGYVSSSFFAARGDRTPVLASRPFRWRHSGPPPDDGDARWAHEDLVAALEDLGWEHEGKRGNAWYATHLVRDPSTVRRSSRKPAATGPAPPRRRSRRAPLTAAAAIALVAAGVAVYGSHETSGAAVPAAKKHHSAAVAAPKKHHSAAVAAPVRGVQTARTVHLDITAQVASWLEIRRGSATGRVLFSGELAAAARLHFRGARLWTRFGAAKNLTITADGRAIPLYGTTDHVFVANRP